MVRRHVSLLGDSHLTAKSSRGITKLDPRLRDAGWDVKNYAVGGLTTREALDSLAGVSPGGPSIFSFGTNDAAPWKQVPLDEFGRNYEQLLRTCAGEIVVVGPTPVTEKLAWPRTNALQRRYSDAAAAVTADVGGAFIDTIELLSDPEPVLLEDGVHLTDLAYEKLAEAVLAALPVVSR
jgi:lysophospholipase L1-like esterase